MDKINIYDKTKNFWNSAPCGTTHMPKLSQAKDMHKYFRKFDHYFFELYPYLKKFLNVKQMRGKTVLEIGLGSGSTLGLESKYAKKVYGLDLSDKTIELNQKRKEYYHLNNLELLCASATEIPLKDNSVDIVVSIGCIHHIPDAEKVIKEIRRVLKPNGIFKGMVYYKDSYRYKYYIPRIRKTEWYWKKKTVQECVNEIYDGKGNPYARVYDKKEMKKLLSGFNQMKFKNYNFNPEELYIANISTVIPRNFWLSTIGRFLGTDLYFSARKK